MALESSHAWQCTTCKDVVLPVQGERVPKCPKFGCGGTEFVPLVVRRISPAQLKMMKKVLAGKETA